MWRYGVCGLALLCVSAPTQETKPTLEAQGKGVQIYTCNVDKGWVFKAPEATLYIGRKKVGSHDAGPRWTWNDGSAVTGKVAKQVPAPNAQNDIPWLVLDATVVEETRGTLSAVKTIRRSDTHGGVAPASGCDAAHGGVVARVPYTATYSFYK
jgi:hypothetical protein